MRLAVDGNHSLPARDVLRRSRGCPEIPFVLEQPCNTLEEIAAIRDCGRHGIYLDEKAEDLRTVIRAAGWGYATGSA